MKASEFFLRTVVKFGVENIFGIVGGEAQAIQFDEVEGLNFYLTRHEFAAGVMADACARITKKPQICYSTFGPGLTNLSTGACSAILDRSPVLMVSAQIDRSEICFNQTHQCIDNVTFMRPLTKYSAQIECVSEIPFIVKKALEISLDGIPGPSYVSFPLDVMKEEINDAEAFKLLESATLDPQSKSLATNHGQLDYIISRINQAKHPIIVAGNQVIREDCCEQLEAFVNKTGMPVLSTLASKGVIAEDHDQFISAGNKYIDKLYQGDLISKIFTSCDLMLLIGYDFGEDLKPSFWKNEIETIVLNSFYSDLGEVFQPDYLYTGDMPAFFDYLNRTDISKKTITNELAQVKTVFSKRMIPENKIETNSISNIMRSIRSALGKSGILCSDIGLHKQYAGLLTKTYEPNTFICSNVCGSFGFGLPAALGAKLVMPDQRVCVICGDGGFHSTSQDLETAVRYNIPIVIVVLNDSAFGLIKYYQLLERNDAFLGSVGFGKVDFVKLAEANGMKGLFLESSDDLESILNKAFEFNSPMLIEIPIKYSYDALAKHENKIDELTV